jgi:hypothetical protein
VNGGTFNILNCCDAGELREYGGEHLIQLFDSDGHSAFVPLNGLRIKYGLAYKMDRNENRFAYEKDKNGIFVEAEILCGERRIKKDLKFDVAKRHPDYKPANVAWCL